MSTLILSSSERFQGTYRRSYTVSEKINVLESLSNGKDDENTVAMVAKRHDIDRTLIYKWQQQKNQLLAASDQRSTARRVSGGGRPSLIADNVRAGLLAFVDNRRLNNLPVTPRMLYHEWLRLDSSITSVSEHCICQRIHRIMRRHDLVVRRTTHQAQRTRNNPKIIADWMDYIHELCQAYGITRDRIANFDETDVQFAVNTNSTIAYKGQKTVAVRSPISSNRCTVMLGVAADGCKFPPYIIYKGKRAARVAREVKKWEEMESKKRHG